MCPGESRSAGHTIVLVVCPDPLRGPVTTTRASSVHTRHDHGSDGRQDTLTDMQALYRFYDHDDDLLYVGITMDPPARFRSHRQTKDWWGDVACIRLEQFGSRTQALDAEKCAIKKEHPRYNVQHSERMPMAEDERFRGWRGGPPNVVEIAANHARGIYTPLGPTMTFMTLNEKPSIAWDDGVGLIFASIEEDPDVYTAK